MIFLFVKKTGGKQNINMQRRNTIQLVDSSVHSLVARTSAVQQNQSIITL